MHDFGALNIVPPLLVGSVRSALSSQGVPGNVISDSGTLDMMQLITLGFDRIEIRTALSPPAIIDLRAKPDPENEKLLREVKPMIRFTGKAGTVQIAPYGVPLGVSHELKTALTYAVIGGVFGLVGVMLFGRAMFGRR